MPKSKTRKSTARPPAPPRQPATLATALLALNQAALELVREAELHITRDVRAGVDPAKSLEVHHYLRTGALGLLIAYSELMDLPDPRQQVQTTTT